MQEELWIEGIRFDLGDRKVSQTFQINEIGEIKDRQGNYSNTVKAPRTPNNIAALNYLGVPGSQSRAPYKKLKAKYKVNGIELVADGYARITDLTPTIDIVVYSGNLSLMETIKGKRLNELNFNDLNHYLNISSFEAGMANTEGYIYALGAFGYKNPDIIIPSERQAPSLYFHTLWKKIFSEAGLTYSGDFFDTNDSFKTEVLPPAKGYQVEDEEVSTNQLGNLDSDTFDINDNTNQPKFYYHDFSLTVNGSLTDCTLLDSQHLRMDFSGVVSISIDVNYLVINGAAGINVKKNDTSVLFVNLDSNKTSESIEIDVAVSEGDTIGVSFRGQNEKTDPELPIYKIDIEAEVSINLESKEGGVFIDFSLFTSEMLQKDFIKDIMQRYGLISQPKGNGHYQFVQIETLCNDRTNAEDWSDKIVSPLVGSESYDLGNYGINNLLKYNYTEDTLSFPQDGAIVVDNEHLESEVDMFTSVFTISNKISELLSTNIYSVPLWEPVYDDEDNLEEVKLEDIEPRIFKVKRVPGTINIKFFEAGPNEITGDIPFLSLEDVQMDYYVQNFFPAFNRMLNAPRKRTDPYFLTPIDIYQLDFFKLKYISQLGQYFYLNKVSNYRPGALTKCELVQVNGISVGTVDGNQPPTQLGVKEFTVQFGVSFSLNLSHFIDTVPPYFDPEYDAPEKIKITSFGSSQIRMRNNGVIITSETVVNADSFNLSIQDLGLTNNQHTVDFDFKIQSRNNTNFSEVTGSIRVNVLEKINRPPIADAGPDVFIEGELDINGSNYDEEIYLQGCNSSDPDGDAITHLWELIDAPVGVTLDDDSVCAPLMDINITNGDDLIQFEVKLTVTDPSGLTDTDIIDVTLTTLSGGGGGGIEIE